MKLTHLAKKYNIFQSLMLAVLCFYPMLAIGQQTNSTWNGGTGSWSNASGWNPSLVPNNSASATFSVNIIAPNSNVSLDVLGATIDNLTLAAENSLTINTGLTLVSGTSANYGTIINNDGGIGVSSVLNLPGSATFNNYGTISGSGGLNVGNITNITDGTFNNYGIFDGGLSNFGTITNSGTLSMSGGSNNWLIEDSGTLSNSGTFQNFHSLDVGATGVLNNTGTIANYDSFGISGTLYNASGAIIDNNDQIFGRIVLSNTGTIINAGTIDNTASVVGGGTVDNRRGGVISSSFQWSSDSINNRGTIIDTSANGSLVPARFSVGTLTNTGTIQSDGNLAKFSIGTLVNRGTVNATNGGTLTVGSFKNKGSLIIDSGSTVNITGPLKLSFRTAGTVTVSSGATLSVGGGSAYTQTKGTTTVDGNLSAVNGIYILGGILNGNGGTLTGNLTLAGAALNPGDSTNTVGELSVSGAYSQTTAGSLDIDLGGTTSGAFDVLNVTGSASLHGTLNVDALNGFTPTVGEQFAILDYGSKTGSFSSVDCTFSNGDACSLTYNSTGAVLTIDAPAASPSAKSSVRGAQAASTPSAVLTPAETCGGLRTFTSLSCITKEFPGFAASVKSGIHGAQSQGTEVSVTHESAAAKSASGPSPRAGGSHASSTSAASAESLSKVSFCAYLHLPSDFARAIGCR
jgi:hypothetical protein